MMTDMPVAERAVRELLRTEILKPAIVGRALDVAVAALQREHANESRVNQLRHQLAKLERELTNLAETAARGGAVPAVLALLGKREEDRRRLVQDLAQQRARVRPLRPVKDLRAQLQEFLSDWKRPIDGERGRGANRS